MLSEQSNVSIPGAPRNPGSAGNNASAQITAPSLADEQSPTSKPRPRNFDKSRPRDKKANSSQEESLGYLNFPIYTHSASIGKNGLPEQSLYNRNGEKQRRRHNWPQMQGHKQASP